MVFHDNTDKNGILNDSDVWNIFNDNDDYVKIDAIVQQDHEQEQVQ